MDDTNKCYICETSCKYLHSNPISANCSVCGNYKISREVINDGLLNEIKEQDKLGLLRGLLFHGIFQDEVITSETIKQIKVKGSPNLKDRAEFLLKEFCKRQPKFGGKINTDDDEEKLISSCYSSSRSELQYIISDFLIDENGYLTRKDKNNKIFGISPKGWFFLSYQERKETNDIFCAMMFKDELKSTFDGVLSPAIKECGYEPVRIDLEDHNNKICDEITSRIKGSRCIVADFTGHRGGVYYEAGYAHGRGIPVIFTCKDTDFKARHFDINQYNFIIWKEHDLEQFKKELIFRIKATLD